MVTTARAKIPYPSENRDPWFPDFLAMVTALDANVYAEWEDRNMFVTGGGLFTWSAVTQLLSWVSIIEAGSAPTGFLWRILAGGLVVLDGQYVYFQATRSPINNVVVADPSAGTLYTGSQVPSSPSQDPTNSIVLAYRRGNLMYFRNGAVLNTGESGNVFEDGGGGDNFSYKKVVATKTVRIPTNQQMIVKGGITIDGTLILDGELELI